MLGIRSNRHIGEILSRYYHSYDPDDGVLYSRCNTGFFSNCMHSLRCLIELAIVGIHPRKLDFSMAFQNYSAEGSSVDLYPRLFQINEDAQELVSDALRNIGRPRLPDHHSVYALYPYREFNPFLDAYFRPSHRVLATLSALKEKYAIESEHTLAVCYRGTDKDTEVKVASASDYLKMVSKVKSKEMRVLIQTDQEQVRKQFCDQVDGAFSFDEMPTTSGSTVLHNLSSTDLGISKQSFAERLLATTVLMSNCKLVINHTGNMAAWICLLRRTAEGVVQFDSTGSLVGPRQIVKWRVKNELRRIRSVWRGETTCYV